MEQKREGFGRPPIPISREKLEGMLIYGATQWECAAEFDCSEETIANFVTAQYEMTFSELRKIHFGKMQLRLKQQQIRTALGSEVERTVFAKKRIRRHGKDKDGRSIDETIEEIVPVKVNEHILPDPKMLIWLGKQLLGQSEDAKHEQDLESLKTRWVAPVIEFSVRDQGNNEIARLRDRWVDQKALPAPEPIVEPEEPKEMTDDDLLEADLIDSP